MTKKEFQMLEAVLHPYLHQQIAIVPKDGSIPTNYCVFTGFDSEYIYTRDIINITVLNQDDKTSFNDIRHIFSAKFDQVILNNSRR